MVELHCSCPRFQEQENRLWKSHNKKSKSVTLAPERAQVFLASKHQSPVDRKRWKEQERHISSGFLPDFAVHSKAIKMFQDGQDSYISLEKSLRGRQPLVTTQLSTIP
ncbi:hypothetical protein ACOMHN_023602 [Nucella lapillus]